MTAQWKSNEPVIPTGACTGTYGSQRNVNLAVNGVENFNYTGNVVCAYLQKAGYYKLEVWGAEGRMIQSDFPSGKGGYSFGKISVTDKSAIYVVVGQSGQSSTKGGSAQGPTAFNGGGQAWSGGGGAGGSGGGTTHISTYNCGELKNCSSYKSNILIVAGGGGGTGTPSNLSCGTYGGEGGGIQGSTVADARLNGYSYSGCSNNNRGGGYGGTQTTGGAGGPSTQYSTGYAGGFGYGGSASGSNGNSYGAGGGGGGWYGGGGASAAGPGGGGGSGYIGNTLLLSDKGMYQYDRSYFVSGKNVSSCTSSTVASTKTTCTSNASSTATANYAKQGDGYARITYLGT